MLGKNSGLNDYMGWLGANFDPSIQWKDLEWIRALWGGNLLRVMRAVEAKAKPH